MRFEQWLSKIQLHQVKQNRLETWKKSDLQNIYQNYKTGAYSKTLTILKKQVY